MSKDIAKLYETGVLEMENYPNIAYKRTCTICNNKGKEYPELAYSFLREKRHPPEPIVRVVTVPGGSDWRCEQCGKLLTSGSQAVKMGAQVFCIECVRQRKPSLLVESVQSYPQISYSPSFLQEKVTPVTPEFTWVAGLTGTRQAEYKGYTIIENLKPTGMQTRYSARTAEGYTIARFDNLSEVKAKIDAEVAIPKTPVTAEVTEASWNSMPAYKQAEIAKSVGLTPRTGTVYWKELTPSERKTLSKAKEPWQMTKKEYRALIFKDFPFQRVESDKAKTYLANRLREHYVAVEKALKEGKPVSRDVLWDYPELQKSNPTIYPEVKYKPSYLKETDEEKLLKFLTTAPGKELTEAKLKLRFGDSTFSDAYNKAFITRSPDPSPFKRAVYITQKGRQQLEKPSYLKEKPILYEARLWRKWANMDDVIRPFATEQEASDYLTHLKYIAKAGDKITIKRSQDWDIKVLHRETIDKDGQFWAIRKPLEPIPTEPIGGISSPKEADYDIPLATQISAELKKEFEKPSYLKEALKGGGTCYEDAWRFLLKEEEGELVHGSVESDGKTINHAWVETLTGFIYEPEHKQFWKKLEFEKIAKPKEHNRYTVEQAGILAVRTGKHGPWTEDERKAFLKPIYLKETDKYGPPETAAPEVKEIWHIALKETEAKYPIGHPLLVAEAKRAGVSQEETQQMIAHEIYIERRQELIEKWRKEYQKEEPPEEEEEEEKPSYLKEAVAETECHIIPPEYYDLLSWLDGAESDYSFYIEPEAKDIKLIEILQKLKDGVSRIHDSTLFRDFLLAMSKFHTYSLSNQMLIALQRPNATLVKGFVGWRDEFGRNVKRGERGIAILRPCLPPRILKCPLCDKTFTEWELRKHLVEVHQREDVSILVREAREEAAGVIIPAKSFEVAHVFDISQTEGKPLPEIEVPVLTGAYSEVLYSKLMQLAEKQSITVSFEPRPELDPAIKGTLLAKSIWIKPDEPEAQRLKTLGHEMAHYFTEHVYFIPRADAEVIAESVAFTVCAHFGFDTGTRSFPYVALWAKEKKVLEQNLASIRKISGRIIEELG